MIYRFVFIAVALLIPFISIDAKPFSYKEMKGETRAVCECRDFHFLNLLFPLDDQSFGSTQKESMLILRFSRIERVPDSQITISKFLDDRIEIIRYSLQKSSLNYYPEDYLLGNPSCDQWKALAENIPVDRRTLNVSPQISKRILDSFSTLSMSPKLDNALRYHGTRYDLWQYTAGQFSRYSISGELLGSASYESPLVRWMNEVYRSLK